MALAILHREPEQEIERELLQTSPLPQAALPVWRTCLREVIFLDESHASFAATAAGQHLTEGHAYRLLLEILCGLQSPMTGETQVLGQFKSFLASLGKDQPMLSRLGQRLLTDARDVRTRHLQGLGSRSYGSAVRRDLAGCSQAVVIGTGKLTAEVLPFLADAGRAVDQWGRAESADRHEGVRYCPLATIDSVDTSELPTALIIAAPVPADVVERVAAKYVGLLRVIDLRADVGSRPLTFDAHVEVISLQDLFARMHTAQESAVPHIEAARQEIAWRTRQYELRDETRPFGWDDLCA
jgi:glutamyl-tRNA reductase